MKVPAQVFGSTPAMSFRRSTRPNRLNKPLTSSSLTPNGMSLTHPTRSGRAEGLRVGHGTSGAATVLRPHRFQELEGLRRRTPLLVALAGRHSEKGGETGMTRGEYASDLLQICQLPATLVSFPRPMSFAQATSSATETHQKGMMFNIAGWSETGDESASCDCLATARGCQGAKRRTHIRSALVFHISRRHSRLIVLFFF